MNPRDREHDREIGARIRALREKKGMSQVDLGRFLGRKDAQGAAHKIEAGKVGLSATDLLRLARHFDASLDQLIVGEASAETLTETEWTALLIKYEASEAARAMFKAHLRTNTAYRITASYVLGFLTAVRELRSVEPAVDAAMLAVAREAAIKETGSADRAAPGALRSRKRKRAR